MELGIRNTFLMLLVDISNAVGREINSCPCHLSVPLCKPDEKLAFSSGDIKDACPRFQRQKCDKLFKFLKTHRIAENVLPMRDVIELPHVHAYTSFINASRTLRSAGASFFGDPLHRFVMPCFT
ncbi:MAG: hypothetical protein A4E65_01457 [Syntrophorhabdus sp. PtaU1.Bin153]|nr:MAG: hypothetical protein A4E65_01457 [Syntrophorhabdus sp. PtaU1.Bin153]